MHPVDFLVKFCFSEKINFLQVHQSDSLLFCLAAISLFHQSKSINF